MRILLVGGVPARLHKGPVDWAGNRFEMVAHAFDRMVRFDLRKPQVPAVVDSEAIEAFLASTRGFDAVVCESPEAVILAREWARRSERPRALVSLEVHGLKRVKAMRTWYAERDGRDPWDDIAALPWISWAAASRVQQEMLTQSGIPPSRIYFIRGNTALYNWLVPEADRLLDGAIEPVFAQAGQLPQDGVVVPGSGRRDPFTLLQAARSLPELAFTVVDVEAERHRDELDATGLLDLPNVKWLEPLPVELYFALLKRSRLVVVPLLEGSGDGGHLTVAIAHRVGSAVVCSRVPGILDYAEDGVNARMVPPADPDELAGVISELWADPGQRERLADNGRKTEKKRASELNEQFLAALSDALAALPESP